ncbi:MAG: alpha/beta hydrolase [Candidatus Bipolaricaulia bacterium]
MTDNRAKLKIALTPILALGLLAGTGFLGGKIYNRINRDIFHPSRGEVLKKTPESYGLSYDRVEFKTGNGITLKGWYLPARNQGKNDCVILAPGKGENRWDMLQYAPFLVQAGFDVLLFDPRSTGLSGGDRYGFGFFESRDLSVATDYVLEEKNVDEVALLGRSAGATASLLAARRNSSIEAVVADSPFANLKLASKDFGSYSSDVTLQLFFPVYMFAARTALGVDIYRKTNILKTITEVTVPVFFIHGLKDEGIGYQNSQKLFDRKKPPKKLWLVPETDHVKAFDNKKGSYTRKVVDFLTKWLQ